MQNNLSPEDFSKHIEERLKKRRFSLALKRLVDIILSLIGLTILLIPFMIISIIIKLTSKGPVFYRQERIKKGNVPFRIFKFRTMVQDADKKGMLITVGEDKRITGIGKFLRKSKIDELPQLINVFIGDMSFVGLLNILLHLLDHCKLKLVLLPREHLDLFLSAIRDSGFRLDFLQC